MIPFDVLNHMVARVGRLARTARNRKFGLLIFCRGRQPCEWSERQNQKHSTTLQNLCDDRFVTKNIHIYHNTCNSEIYIQWIHKDIQATIGIKLYQVIHFQIKWITHFSIDVMILLILFLLHNFPRCEWR